MKHQRENKQTVPNPAARQQEPATLIENNKPNPEDRIRKRAQEIQQAHGAVPGRDLDNWLQAEREIKAESSHASEAGV
jgi:hypothetical protein